MSQFELKLDAFEGPLDLLLYLVNRHKLDIYDIEISLLLEQYLEYIDGLEQEDFDQAGDFLAMAARLVYIKTCSLLPKAEEAEELKKELEGELIEYSVCKAAAERLRGICIYGDVFVRPPEKLPVNKVFTGTMDPQLLIKAYLGMSAKARSMKPIRAEQFKPIVASRIVTVTSKIVHVLKMLYTLGRCTVAELYEGVDDKSARVATFLAVLELTKSGRIMLNEDNTEITFNRDAPRRRRESPPQPKHEAAAASAEIVPAREPAQAAESTEQPACEKERPRTAAAVRYSGAVRTASGATMALPALAVFIYEDSAREVPPDEPQTVDIGDGAIYGGIKYNRFAARYFWGYPSAGNCYRYRRERL